MAHMSPRLKERRGRFAGAGFDPVVTLTSPSSPISVPRTGSPLPLTASVPATATAVDAQDGDIASSLDWVSDLDGPVGTGAAPTLVLSVGVHVVTLTATDSNSNTGSDVLDITIT